MYYFLTVLRALWLRDAKPAQWAAINRFLFFSSYPGSLIPDLGLSVSHWVSHCHLRIFTQIVTFETWDPSDIWSDKKGKKKKKKKKRTKNTKKNTKEKKNEWDKRDKNAERQKDKKTKKQKTEKLKRQKRQPGQPRTKRQKRKGEFNIVMSGQFRTLAMFFRTKVNVGSDIWDLTDVSLTFMAIPCPGWSATF